MTAPAVPDLAARVLEAIAETEREASEQRGVFPHPVVTDDGAVWLHVWPDGNAVLVRYLRPDLGYNDIGRLKNWANAKHGATAEVVLRRCAADRDLIAEITSWEHVRDGYYSCALALDPGETELPAARAGRECACGLDSRRERILRGRAEVYGITEDGESP